MLAYAYEDQLRSGALSIAGFARVRVVRLYPLTFLGTASGIALAIVAAGIKGTVTYQQIALSGSLGLLLLPSYEFPQWSTAYPFNMASWSLAFELFVNAVYVLIAPILSLRRLIILAGFSAAALVWLGAVRGGIDGGNDQNNFLYGFPRVMFPFFAGVLLFRMRRAPHTAPHTAPRTAMILVAALATLLLLPVRGWGLAGLFYVLMLFPLFIVIGAAVDVGPRLGRLFAFAGLISFPVYILQGPVLRVGEELLKHMHVRLAGFVAVGVMETAVVVAVAYAAVRFFDKPLQSRLKRPRASRGMLGRAAS